MSAIDLAATMDAIAARLTAAGVVTRAYGWPAGSVQPPCAIVGYPEDGNIEYDVTFQRGSDKALIPVWIVAGAVHDRSSRDVLSAYIGAGARSVKAALDGDLGGAAQTARVTDCQIEKLPIGAVEYVTARFDVEVYT